MHVVRSKVKASGDRAVFVCFMTGSRCQPLGHIVCSRKYVHDASLRRDQKYRSKIFIKDLGASRGTGVSSAR